MKSNVVIFPGSKRVNNSGAPEGKQAGTTESQASGRQNSNLLTPSFQRKALVGAHAYRGNFAITPWEILRLSTIFSGGVRWDRDIDSFNPQSLRVIQNKKFSPEKAYHFFGSPKNIDIEDLRGYMVSSYNVSLLEVCEHGVAMLPVGLFTEAEVKRLHGHFTNAAWFAQATRYPIVGLSNVRLDVPETYAQYGDKKEKVCFHPK